MSHTPIRMRILVVLAALSVVAPIWAEETEVTAPASRDDSVARLEALLAAQQTKIDALEQQVAAAQQADMSAARVAQMKQQIREVLSEQEFRESLMPAVAQAGYDNGFFIKSSDEKFKIRINALFQFRWAYYATRTENRYLSPGLRRSDRTGFDFTRIRLRFSGHAYSPDLTYALQLMQDAGDAYDTRLIEAWVNYRMVDEFQLKMGYFRLASTHAQSISHDSLQFVDRPVTDTVFGFGYGIGVRLWGQAFEKRLEYFLDVVNSTADGENGAIGRTITTDEQRELDGNPAILFRTVWHVLGDNRPNDFSSEADLPRHTTPALDLGFHYAYNEDNWDRPTTRIPFPRRTFFRDGGFGLTNSNGLQMHQFGVDAAFKYQGFSAIGEYMLRVLDVRDTEHWPYAPLWQLTGDDSTNAQHGGYVQCGYMLPIPGFEDKLEVVARVGGISALSGGQEGTWEYAGGLNYYIQGNKVKLQTDVTKVSEVPITSPYATLANVNDDALIWRVQLQVAF